MACTELNFEDIATNLMPSEYRLSLRLIGHMQAIVSQMTDVQKSYCQLYDERDIDSAIGAQLDIIGKILGQSRTLVAKNLFDYFGFNGSGGLSYGSIDDPSVGGIYASLAEIDADTNIILTDTQYRILLKATTFKNRMRSTPEDDIELISEIFGIQEINVIESTQKAFFMIGKKLSSFEKTMIKLEVKSRGRGANSFLVPRTFGVQYEFGSYDPKTAFKYGKADSPDRFDKKNGYGSGLPPNTINGGKYAGFF